jgi:hypothetical protein
MILPHRTLPIFWMRFDALPDDVRELARSAYAEWLNNPRAPGLRFKHLAGDYYSVRIGRNHRAICKLVDKEWHWFWIGPHSEYDKILKGIK